MKIQAVDAQGFSLDQDLTIQDLTVMKHGLLHIIQQIDDRIEFLQSEEVEGISEANPDT